MHETNFKVVSVAEKVWNIIAMVLLFCGKVTYVAFAGHFQTDDEVAGFKIFATLCVLYPSFAKD